MFSATMGISPRDVILEDKLSFKIIQNAGGLKIKCLPDFILK